MTKNSHTFLCREKKAPSNKNKRAKEAYRGNNRAKKTSAYQASSKNNKSRPLKEVAFEGEGTCILSQNGDFYIKPHPPLPDWHLPLSDTRGDAKDLFPGDKVKVHISPRRRWVIKDREPQGKSFIASVSAKGTGIGRYWIADFDIDGRINGSRIYRVEGVPEDFRGSRAFVHAHLATSKQEEADPFLVFEKEAPSLWAISSREEKIKIERDIPRDFSQKALAEAAALPEEPSEEDMADREDLRKIPFVTIDGDDSRDFDDAIHVEKKGEAYLLRVAIADVSHYVRLGSAMDKEALKRGNSWYFPSSVEHMLPTPLSCGLCSLMPDKDRLVVYANILFKNDGFIAETAFGVGVIRSAARLRYDEVRDILLKGDEEKRSLLEKRTPKAEEIISMLGDALELFKILKKASRARGMLDFNIPEVKGSFDAKGMLTNLSRAERHEIHELIEQFMLAANEAVARKLEASGNDFLYRVHPAPTKEKLLDLKRALSFAGMNVVCDKDGIPSLEKIFSEAKGTPLEFIASRLCLRSMQQACYDIGKEIHFGLGLDCYCHFTSPIRRYADLCVHRVLKNVLGKDSGAFYVGQKLNHVATQINDQGKKAQECERDMQKCLGILWARNQKSDKKWSATVTSVMSFGVFVELDEVPVEGLIHISSIGYKSYQEAEEAKSQSLYGDWEYNRLNRRKNSRDWLEFDERTQTISSYGQNRSLWRVGCKVDVICVKSDINSLQIDFFPVGNPVYAGRPSERPDKAQKKAKTFKKR